ncbi:MAG: tRNA (N6-threonylcarbamoyladenosine(37)-N6)-methyltransferase TrmO [Calditrichaeota bacterium]|nr:tRNA (N6-threonylcarbamoyladenosine(37)-N6)-methyltransferase TrmO [Calditrichota bacterium]
MNEIKSATFNFSAIGYVRSHFRKKYEAPKQPQAGFRSDAKIVLNQHHNFEMALSDLDGFERIWLIYVFDRNSHWRPKVLPPRQNRQKRGVFATRSPYRPNPIGISVVRLLRIKGRTLYIEDHDLLDGTAILDIKPYLSYSDAFPDSKSGWLENLTEIDYSVTFSEDAELQLNWLTEQGIYFKNEIEKRLSYDPFPHPYRRIKVFADHSEMSFKEWTCSYYVNDQSVHINHVYSGFPSEKIKKLEKTNVHQLFLKRFGIHSSCKK